MLRYKKDLITIFSESSRKCLIRRMRMTSSASIFGMLSMIKLPNNLARSFMMSRMWAKILQTTNLAWLNVGKEREDRTKSEDEFMTIYGWSQLFYQELLGLLQALVLIMALKFAFQVVLSVFDPIINAFGWLFRTAFLNFYEAKCTKKRTNIDGRLLKLEEGLLTLKSAQFHSLQKRDQKRCLSAKAMEEKLPGIHSFSNLLSASRGSFMKWAISSKIPSIK